MAAEDDEDDYMNMVIEEPQQKETFTQKKRRLQREAEARARVPSKAERAAQEAAKRDAALATSTLNSSNKGFQMMAKLGFKPGQSLGKPAEAPSTGDGDDKLRSRAEPLNLIMKEDRGGIGLDSERKRKIREEAEEAAKKVKVEEGDYRDRVRLERETKRTEAQIHAAQKVAERLDADENGEASLFSGGADDKDESKDKDERGESEPSEEKTKPKVNVKPTAKINVLYRGLVREREEKERAIQTRHMLQQSLPTSFFSNPRLPGYNDTTLDLDDHEALGGGRDLSAVLEQEVEEEDPELDEFNALEPAERLRRLVLYLREKHLYCFWCKYRYETAEDMEGCPGLTEEDHD
ncbi:putative G-patch domain protein [Aspergillus stella-maris]|uniref:putative G-patch domain protein n=1 Tax=Aspergillus stella-maris TaxID=1810926 RepID=UPI003CCD1D4B